MYLYLKCNVKWGTQNLKIIIINQQKNVQSLEKDLNLSALNSFDNVFTQDHSSIHFPCFTQFKPYK
jgi:hypothetical protein